jgi:hypothetical protein
VFGSLILSNASTVDNAIVLAHTGPYPTDVECQAFLSYAAVNVVLNGANVIAVDILLVDPY